MRRRLLHRQKWLLFSLLLSLSACKAAKKGDEAAIDVYAYVVEPQVIPDSPEFWGVARSSHLVEIWSRVQGYLEKIVYTEGAYVNAGDPLFQIDKASYEIAVQESKASLEQEKSNLLAAQKAVERYKPLVERRAISRKDLDNGMAQLDGELAAVDKLQAQLEQSELNLGYTSIVSPISGLTTVSNYREGTLVTPETGTFLTTVAVVDPIWVIIGIPDTYFLRSEKEVASGELSVPENYFFDVCLTLEDGSSYPHPGKVTFISPVFDPNTGVLNARAVFPNPDRILKPGQFVRARTIGAKRLHAIAVPKEAVVQGARGQFVYVIDRDSRAKVRSIEVGDWYEKDWIIKSGLSKGDVVITSGVNKVKEGSLVKVKNKKRKRCE